MFFVWQLIIYISSYYIGLEKYKNYFMINMVLESMNYGSIINAYDMNGPEMEFFMILEWLYLLVSIFTR